MAVPFLCIQPLVENAVRHGLEGAAGRRHHHHPGPRPRPRVRDRGRGRRGRRGPGAVRRALAGDAEPRLGRARQRRRAAAHDVRRRLRPGRRDRPRRRHQGDGAGAEVRARGARHDHGSTSRCACWSSTTSGPRSTSCRTCSPQDARIGEVRRLRLRDRGAADPARARGRRGLPRHPDARADRARAGPGAERASGPRRRSSSSPRTRQHAVDAFELHAVDYVLKPVREERLAEAVRRVIEGGDRAPAPAERRADPRRARRRDPLRRPLRRHPRRGARRLRPAAHRRAAPT